MKKSSILYTVALTVILTCAMLFSMGCDYYPRTLVSSVVADGSGGTIIVYEFDRSDSDEDIRIQRRGANGNVLWDNTLFTSQSNRSSVEGMTGDGEGNIIINWTVLIPQEREEGRPYSERATVASVEAQGQILWQKDVHKKDVQAICDGSGSAIIIWHDMKILCAQRIDGQGNLLWEKCFSVSGYGLRLVINEMGEALILRDNFDNNYFTVQKLSSSGEVLWGQEGVRINYLTTDDQQQPQIVSDGSGGAIITWAEVLLDKGQPASVFALRVGADGSILWKSPVRTLMSVVHPQTRVVSDGLGGAIAVWEDHRQGMAIYAQKVSTEGKALWRENGVPVCTDLPQVSPRFDAVVDGNGSVVVAWIDRDRKLYAQTIDAMGQRQWGDGILISTGNCDLPVKISQDGQGGVIIGWATGYQVHHPKQAYVQRIDPDGKLLWGEEGIRLNP